MLVHQWAATSMDTHPQSVALQLAAAEEFGLHDTAELSHVDRAAMENGRALLNQTGVRPGYKAFLQAMYDNTQDWLEAQGVDEVQVYRGIELPSLADREVSEHIQARTTYSEERRDVSLQPMSSFATDPESASDFMSSYHGAMLAMRVPKERVLSLCITGFGCRSEDEVVVLGGPGEAVVYEHRNNGGRYKKWGKLETLRVPSTVEAWDTISKSVQDWWDNGVHINNDKLFIALHPTDGEPFLHAPRNLMDAIAEQVKGGPIDWDEINRVLVTPGLWEGPVLQSPLIGDGVTENPGLDPDRFIKALSIIAKLSAGDPKILADTSDVRMTMEKNGWGRMPEGTGWDSATDWASELLNKSLAVSSEPPLNLDADLRNADWPKRSWDLQLDTPELLARWLDATGIDLPHFAHLPVCQHNRQRLPWLDKLLKDKGIA